MKMTKKDPIYTKEQIRERLQSIATLAVSLQDVDPKSREFGDVWEDLYADVEAIEEAHAHMTDREFDQSQGPWD